MTKTFEQHAIDCYPQEACGYIDEDKNFHPLENIHPSPAENFLLSGNDSFSLADRPNIVFLHSHTFHDFKGDPRIPSYEDMKSQEAMGNLWGIVHCDSENASEALYFGHAQDVALLDRFYIPNVYDCFTIARDFYWQEYRTDLGSHPRPADWEQWNPHYITQTYGKLGFYQVLGNSPVLRGDVLLFSIASQNINHIGIALDDKKFIHHLCNRLSCVDIISRWDRQLVKILRRT